MATRVGTPRKNMQPPEASPHERRPGQVPGTRWDKPDTPPGHRQPGSQRPTPPPQPLPGAHEAEPDNLPGQCQPGSCPRPPPWRAARPQGHPPSTAAARRPCCGNKEASPKLPGPDPLQLRRRNPNQREKCSTNLSPQMRPNLPHKLKPALCSQTLLHCT